jgi:hypothetical protein
MNARPSEIGIISAGFVYLMALGWAIGNTSYDAWGALVVAPVYGILGVAIVHRMFRGAQQRLARVLAWGLLVKLAGTLARYWVGFEAYEGGIDASRYHQFAAEAAGKVWSGEENFVTVLPRSTGTPFLEHFTAFVYTLSGSSQLAGFITFSFLAYLGTVLMVKAAVIAVPNLAASRYAWLCVLFPSIVYWPSSIGKEATIFLGLGVATYGIGTLFAYGRWIRPVVLIGAGLGFTSLVRPHIAGIWVAAAVPGLVVALLGRSRSNPSRGQRRLGRLGAFAVLVVALAGISMLAGATVRYLDPDEDEVSSTSVTQILEETSRRTSEAGSRFTPPSVASPTDWPAAIARTLTRPLPLEARGLAQLISSAEMMALLGLYAISWRRLLNLPRLLVTNPYVTFTVTAVALVGLAYSSFANLGVLTRQKSLIFPLLVLLPCLPVRSWTGPSDRTSTKSTEQPRRERRTEVAGGAATSTSERSDQLPGRHHLAPSLTQTGRSDDDLWA